MEGLGTEESVLRYLQRKHHGRPCTPTNPKTSRDGHMHARNEHAAQPAAANASCCTVVLDVGGLIFKTTEETLCSVKGSRLCHMLGQAESQAASAKTLFIDRNGEAFAFILEYLRAFRAKDADFALPPAHLVAAVLAEALYFQLPGLTQLLRHCKSAQLCKTLQRHDDAKPTPINLPVEFATVQAAVSSNKPQLDQAALQELSKQLNQQIQVYTRRGFQIKDVNSGMTHGFGGDSKAHILYVSVLLSTRLQAVDDTAKLDLLQNVSGFTHQAILRRNSTSSDSSTKSSLIGVGRSASGTFGSSPSDTLMSETKQPLHTSIAPAADPAEHLPTTSWVPVPTPQSDAASGSFSLASQDEMLMPTPRLGSSSQKQGSSPDMCAIDAQPTTSSLSDHVSDELLQPGVQRQPDPSRDGISSTIASELTEPAVTTGRPHKLLADSIGEEDCQAEVWQDSGSTILLTNDLFQQLPDRSMAAQQSHQWQANDIFETQTSIAESTRAGRALSAASDQYSSVLISSSSSSLRHVDSSHVLKESAQSKQGTLEQHENTIDVDDSSSTPLVSACKQQHSTLQQQQVFSELFDTQLSQILTSQEDMFGSSAELPSSSQVADAEADSAPVLVAGSARGSTADLALDSILVSMRSTASGDAGVDSVQSSTQCHDLYRSTAAVATDAATAAATASESCAAFLLCMEHQEAMKREPLRAAVSTAQLEVMGWDMFTDTLGTFRLLSDTDSDVESTHNLLPEPSELGPVTPEAAEHQLAMNHGWYMENAPAVPYTTELSAFLDDFPGHSHIELIDSNVSVVPADKFVMDDHVSCLEREFQTVMSDRQGLVEAYPGMSSDAEEFDGDGSPGCLGQHASCAGRLEECVTCSPCATCSCYPYAALRPGKRHQKTKLKRVWARVRNMGDACLHPKFLHESYT